MLNVSLIVFIVPIGMFGGKFSVEDIVRRGSFGFIFSLLLLEKGMNFGVLPP